MCKKAVLKTMLIALLLVFSGKALAGEIVIAVAAPLTGPAAKLGSVVKKAATTKVNEFNAAGGVNGQNVEIVAMDEQCSPKKALSVAKKIAKDSKIIGVVGHLCSRAHIASLPVYIRKGVPVISPFATAPAIRDKSFDKKGKVWAFRTVNNDGFKSQIMARYAKVILELDRIAVFYHNSHYGKIMRRWFVDEAKRIDLTIVGEETYDTGAKSFTKQLLAFKRKNPDGLFIAGIAGEGAHIASQAHKLGMDIPKFADLENDPKYVKLAGDAADNTYFTSPELAKGKWLAASALDATGILLQAIAQSGPDRSKVREYLASIDSPQKAYEGMTGPVYFDEKGDCLRPPFVRMILDKKIVPAPKQLK